MRPPKDLVVLAAGGTGGHLFPAEALARALMARGRPVALVTDRRAQDFPVEGVPTYRVPAGRFRAGIVGKVGALIEIGRGALAARSLLRRLDPGAVVGFGGYPSVPTMLAACWLRLPSLIHEQNAVLGRANLMLSGRVRRIATGFETVRGLASDDRCKIVETGNPVRPAILALRNQSYDPPEPGGPIRLLVIGGSQGARILSRIVPEALKALPRALQARLQVAQQVRTEDADSCRAAYASSGITVETKRFFEDLPERLGTAHLVITRSGGSTVAELTTAGRPAILVPFAAALADEQTANARVLVERGAAWLLAETDFTAGALSAQLERILNHPAALARAAAAARRLGQPEAAQRLADLVETVEWEGWR
ncbi:MAG: UDP-N-acetylglucosamine--N-acetylmuramyl-(pentapeptide) pyrophosphoryl-undecaprenol [Aliidongia sp.]|nr:UDP-N-acetylglucosamine--N-acetylmuramyl-(pentapeptide) pyrophosphoryl-undecaprenol [Aliidongia sp.]